MMQAFPDTVQSENSLEQDTISSAAEAFEPLKGRTFDI